MTTMKQTSRVLFLILGASMSLAACLSPSGGSNEARRDDVLEMRSDVLAELYRLVPEARSEIDTAEGYGVFSNVGVHIIFASLGNGYGVVEDNSSGERTYMRMLSAGLGFGLGIKDFRGIFVFTRRRALENFIERGWDASAQADIAAKSGDRGGAFAGAFDVAQGIRLYQITEAGLAIQATIQGTKYWRDDDLTSRSATLTGP
ncbi:MAG: hypothetical protein O7A03_03040 [Alphaproteobacteria bacterium]|nr:hypothetical protein [Alphaproteobacteria bacterium]